MRRIIAPLLSATLLTGCASIVDGQNQSISVNTTPKEGATCNLSNDKGTWYVSQTPGSVTVQRAYGPLTVICEKAGYGKGITAASSSTKGMAFGNALFGGVIGAGVDIGTGAAYDYPQAIIVDLVFKDSKKSKRIEAED